MGTHHAEQLEVAASLYRRLPIDWWRKHQPRGTLYPIPFSRFTPKKQDADGLSVSQVGISSIETASTTAKGKRDCLAEFSTTVATNRGLTLEPKPTEHDPGHAIIPEMNYAAMEDPETETVVEEHAQALAEASKIAWPPEGMSPDQL